MAYESNPAGLGVGKEYGAKSLGGIRGEVYTSGMEKTLSFQVNSDTADALYEAVINCDYLIKEIVLNVKEAFAASSTADFSIDGGAGLTTDLDLATAGISSITTLTGLANTSGSGPVDIALSLSAQALASASGDAEITVKYDIAG